MKKIRSILSRIVLLVLAALSVGGKPPVAVLPVSEEAREQAGNMSTQSKRVLILFEGSDIPSNLGRGDARELAMLLGHFNVQYTLKVVDAYAPGDINKFDLAFFIGFSKRYDPPERFLRDVYATQKQFVWM